MWSFAQNIFQIELWQLMVLLRKLIRINGAIGKKGLVDWRNAS